MHIVGVARVASLKYGGNQYFIEMGNVHVQASLVE